MSVNEFRGPSISAVAAEALTQYRFVNLAGTTAVEAMKCSISDTGEVAVGIVAETVASGDNAPIFLPGSIGLLCVDGGTDIAAGDHLKPHTDSSGKGIKTTTDKDFFGAVALEPATDDADVIRVMIVYGYHAA